jgi:hypothetical protein
MLARDGDVVEEDVRVGVPTGGDLVVVEQEAGTGVRAALHDQQCGPRPKRVDRGAVLRAQPSPHLPVLDLGTGDTGEPHGARLHGEVVLIARGRGVAVLVTHVAVLLVRAAGRAWLTR